MMHLVLVADGDGEHVEGIVHVLGANFFAVLVLLEALGVENYGLFNLIVGFVTLFTLLNGAMQSTVQRFLCFELGKESGGDTKLWAIESRVNQTLGISASIGSNRNANELVKHLAPGENEEMHKFAAKNVGKLFERGTIGIRHLDKKAFPGQRWPIRFIRVFSPFVFADRRLLATITLKENPQGGNFYSVEAVGITKDACSERTPRGAMSEDLNAAPFLEHAPLLNEIISYYVGDINRTRPEFIGLPEPFTIQAAVTRLLAILEDGQQDVPNLCPTVPALAKDTRLHLIRCEEIPYEQGK